MSGALTARLKLTAFVLLALLGTWLGHGMEYARVAGLRGLADGLGGPLHAYMVPAGALLGAFAFIVAAELAQLAQSIHRHYDELRAHAARALRRATPSLPKAEAPIGRRPFHAGSLFASLACTQLLFYVLQENIEAGVAGLPAQGLGALGGVHWAAPLVHLTVAALLTVGAVAIRRAFTARLRTVARVARLLIALLRLRRVDTTVPRPLVGAPREPSWRAAARILRAPPEPVGT